MGRDVDKNEFPHDRAPYMPPRPSQEHMRCAPRTRSSASAGHSSRRNPHPPAVRHGRIAPPLGKGLRPAECIARDVRASARHDFGAHPQKRPQYTGVAKGPVRWWKGGRGVSAAATEGEPAHTWRGWGNIGELSGTFVPDLPAETYRLSIRLTTAAGVAPRIRRCCCVRTCCLPLACPFRKLPARYGSVARRCIGL